MVYIIDALHTEPHVSDIMCLLTQELTSQKEKLLYSIMRDKLQMKITQGLTLEELFV